jgi:hypothetical protein
MAPILVRLVVVSRTERPSLAAVPSVAARCQTREAAIPEPEDPLAARTQVRDLVQTPVRVDQCALQNRLAVELAEH